MKGKFSKTWRAKAMHIVFACALVFGLSAVLIAAPVGAVGETEVCGCLAGPTTEWAPSQTHTGDYTPELTNANTYAYFVPGGGIAVSDLDDITASPEWSYWYNLTGTGSHGVELELRFTSSYCTNPDGAGHVDVTVFSGSSDFTVDSAWHKRDVLATSGGTIYYGNMADGTAFSWEGGGGGTGVATTLGDVIAAIEANTTLTPESAVDWELTRVGMQLYVTGTAMVDGVTIDGTTYDIEPCYSLVPNLALNVKTADATFIVKDTCGTELDGSFVSNWIVTKGEGAGDVTLIAGGTDGDNFITLRMVTTGDCIITVDVDYPGDGTEEVTLNAEKKWGELHHTILDVDASTTVVEHTKTVRREEGVVHVETLKDTVYAEFLELLNPQTAGGALVNWWLFKDTTANQDAIDDLMDDLAANNGFLYDGYWSATGQYDPDDPPIDAINALHATQHATDTEWTVLDPTGTIYTVDATDTYATNVTEDSLPTDVRGTVLATLSNDGDDEAVMIVVLVDYPIDKNGENRICIEKGKKTFTTVVVPPPYLEKIPQVAWAGEKVTLEQSWGTDFNGQLVSFQLEHPGLGTLEAVNAGDYQVSGDLVYTKVIGGVARCILDSEDPGQADIKVVLREDDMTNDQSPITIAVEVENGLEGIVVQTGLVVYYLKLESITPLDPDPAALVVDVDAEFGIEVKGWFTSSNTSTRVARPVDHDGDGEMDAILPAGRWVMPDDWRVLAGADWETLRPHWDIMDAPGDDIISEVPYDEWGAYNSDVSTPAPPIGPGEAEYPVIGPFSLLQPFAAFQWLATAMVPADATVSLTGLDVRTTVVPDGLLDAWDCPMPPAEIIFNADSDLSEADKGDIYVTALGAYTTPFYASEIPATQYIPPMIAGNGYEWDSWGTDGLPTTDEGPYDFWTDLNVSPLDDEALEVYSDNHGIAYLTIDALSSAGSVIISATADYPYLTGKHGAMKSDEVTQTWGEPAPDTYTWSFSAAGFFPRHLPDTYTGEVVLADLILADIPDEVLGVWYYDEGTAVWIFWVPGVGGDLLVLEGGLVADYNVLVSGACDWIIPLP